MASSYDLVEALVKKRLTVIDYIRQSCTQPESHRWVGVVALATIVELKQDPRRAGQLYVLGVSLGELGDISVYGMDYIRAIDTLFAEYESFAAGQDSKKSAPMIRIFRSQNKRGRPLEDHAHLRPQFIPFDLSLGDVVIALCDVLYDIYMKSRAIIVDSMDNSGRVTDAELRELITRIDSRVCKLVLDPIVREREERSRSLVQTELAKLEIDCII